MRGRISAWLAAALLAGLVLSAGALPDPKRKWIEVTTANFRLLSEAGDRKTAEIALSLERFRQVLSRLKPGISLVSPVPIKILVFENDRNFAPYKDHRIAGREDMLGFFLSHRLGNSIALNAFPRHASSLPVIYHEFVHFYVRHNLPHLPLWANEGLAEYYSSFEEIAGEVAIGVPLRHHVSYLRERSFLPLARLFAVDATSPEYNETEKQGGFYATSWALTHYLLADLAPRPRGAAEFLRRLTEGEAPEAASEAALGLSIAELEGRLRGYVKAGRFPFLTVAVDDLEAPTGHASRPLAREEVLFELGDLLAHGSSGGQLGEAEEHFRAAIATNERYPEGYTGLGELAAERGSFDAALAWYEQAESLGTRRFETWVLHADAILERLRAQGPAAPGSAPEAEWRRARVLLEQAVAAAPTFGEAQALLASTYFYDPAGSAGGLEAMRRSLALLPERADLAYNYAILLLSAGRVDDAEAVVRTELAARQRPDLASGALEAIARWRLIDAANRASHGGGDTDAVALYRQAVEATTDPALRATMAKELARLERQAAENGAIKRYNRAIEMANQGSLEPAVEELQALARELDDGNSLKPEVERLLDELRSALR